MIMMILQPREPLTFSNMEMQDSVQRMANAVGSLIDVQVNPPKLQNGARKILEQCRPETSTVEALQQEYAFMRAVH